MIIFIKNNFGFPTTFNEISHYSSKNIFGRQIMINVTDQIKGSDTHLKTAGSKITRYDMLENKLKKMALTLNESKKIKTVVYDNTGKDKEFVEEVSGTLDDAKEILAYYNENFILDLKMKKNENKVIIYMLKPLKKSVDEDLEDKRKELENQE